jgi:hypothetical protein
MTLNAARTAAEAQALTDRSNPAGIFLNIAEIEWLLGSELRLARTAPPTAELAAMECLGFGRHRVVFSLPSGEVLKIARNFYGQEANEEEAAKSGGDRNPRATATEWHGISAVIVERVTPISKDHPLFPAWAGEHDDDQIGLTADGRVVVFDA